MLTKTNKPFSQDGYRLHQNPDHSWVFVEGRRNNKLLINRTEARAINAAYNEKFPKEAPDIGLFCNM
jgi:hypothetical protein